MMRNIRFFAALWLGSILLIACDSPPAPGPSATETVQPNGPTAGLKQLEGRPRYNVETISGETNPLMKMSVEVPADELLTVTGWAVDEQSQTAAGGVDVVIDGKPYPARYGLSRTDVAKRFELPAYTNSGFELSTPAAAVGKGTHRLSVRVISSDKSSYWEGRTMAIDVQ